MGNGQCQGQAALLARGQLRYFAGILATVIVAVTVLGVIILLRR